MFLVKTNNSKAESLKVRILPEYCALEIPYYLETGKYLELKYRLRSSELHMEFYLDLLHDLRRPRDNFLGVYSESKYLVATKISRIL
jgi:hypothetical protein